MSVIAGYWLEVFDAPVMVYNLEVEGFHTYFVGEFGVLVHNSYSKGDQTPGGREFTQHGAIQANERGFTDKEIDKIIDSNRKTRIYQPSNETYRYQDKRGNTVIMNLSNQIVTVFSHPQDLNDSSFIPKNFFDD